MRGLQVLLDRFFSTPAGTPVRADNGSIDAPQFLVDFASIDGVRPQAVENLVERPIGVPRVEQAVHRFPRRELVFGQVSPGRTGSQHPKDRIDNRSSTASAVDRSWREVETNPQSIPIVHPSTDVEAWPHPPWHWNWSTQRIMC